MNCPACNIKITFSDKARCDACNLDIRYNNRKIEFIFKCFENKNRVVWNPISNICTYQYYNEAALLMGQYKSTNVIMSWLPFTITEQRLKKLLVYL